MAGPIGATPFAINERESLLKQFVEQLPAAVDELHVSAPYYDREALALAAIIDQIKPKQFHLYIGLGTKVHGPSLAAGIDAADRGARYAASSRRPSSTPSSLAPFAALRADSSAVHQTYPARH